MLDVRFVHTRLTSYAEIKKSSKAKTSTKLNSTEDQKFKIRLGFSAWDKNILIIKNNFSFC